MKTTTFLAAAFATHTETNPIGQVLTLLQNLYNTVVSDGEKEQKQFEVFAEWCEDQAKERQFEIKTGKAQVANLRATIEKASADIDAGNARVSELSQSIAANDADLKAATSIRAKEHSTFKKEESELVETVDTLRRAQQVLSKHMKEGSFTQLPQAIKDLTTSLSVILDGAVFSTHDKAQLQAFLQAQEGGVDAPTAKAYSSHSTGILDTLADMQEKAEGLLADARKSEVNTRHAYELLAQSLTDELKVQREDASNTKKQLAATSETKATAEGDLASTTKDLNEDEAYLRDLSLDCQQRANDFEISTKGRAEELQALRDARTVIGEATGAASKRQYREFLQVSTQKMALVTFDKIEASIKALGKQDHNFAMMQLAGQIRATVAMSADPFSKVKGLIQDMISRLEQQAQEEASHKAFCDKETQENEAKRDKLQAELRKLNTRIEKQVAGVAMLKEQIAELQNALLNIAKAQKEMEAMRKEERESFLASKADFEKGLTGVRTGIKILREYYQAKGGSFVQQPVVATHGKSSDSGSSIISILEVAESDFARSLADSQEAEDDAQDTFDKITQQHQVSTATKKASVAGKTQESARLQQSIADATGDRKGVQQELAAVLEYLEKLRPQCTTEAESYEDRKARREHEIDGLKDALDILENETAFAQESPSFLSLRSIRRHS